MNRIKITGISDLSKFDNYVASNLVDVAYVEEINDATIILSLEDGIDLDNEDDKRWITGLIEQAISECDEWFAKMFFQLNGISLNSP